MDAWIGREGERKEFTKKKERKPPKAILFFCDIIEVTLPTCIIFEKYG